MELDLVVTGGRLVTPAGVSRADLGISRGRIATVAAAGTLHSSKIANVDADGLVVFPGGVDTHVHFRAPAHADRETFESGSRAAAAGGVTTVLEMPTSDPTVLSAGNLQERIRAITGSSYVDFGMYGGAGRGTLGTIREMAAAGAIAFKTFLHRAAPGREFDIGPITATTTAELLECLREIAATGLVGALHCEDDALLDLFQAEARKSGLRFGDLHAKARPMLVENVAVMTAALIGHDLDARIHFVHTTSPLAISLVDELRQQGLDASIETAPHYLLFSDETLRTHEEYAKCNPPLRPNLIRQELLQQAANGLVDNVASDHCPYTAQEISEGRLDPIHAPAGLPGIEYMLPSLLTLVSTNDLSLERVAELFASRPAERFGIQRKGILAPGFDADFVLLDVDERWSPDLALGQSLGAQNAHGLDGFQFVGRVKETWLRGRPVFRDGAIEGEMRGTWIPGAAYNENSETRFGSDT